MFAQLHDDVFEVARADFWYFESAVLGGEGDGRVALLARVFPLWFRRVGVIHRCARHPDEIDDTAPSAGVQLQ